MFLSKVKTIIFHPTNSHPKYFVYPNQEWLISSILWTTIVVNIIFSPVILFILSNPFPTLLSNNVFLIIQIGLLIALKRGYLNFSKYAFLILLWLFITFVLLFFGGIKNPAHNAFLLVVLIAGLVIGRHGALAFSLLSITSSFIIFIIEISNLLPEPLFPLTQAYIWSGLLIFLVATATVLYIALRTIEISNLQRHKSSEHLRAIFEGATVSLIAQDFSLVINEIATLKENGITNFRDYFEKHPNHVRSLAQKASIIDCNSNTLSMYDAATKEELLITVDRLLTEKSYKDFREQLIAIAKSQQYFQTETINTTLTGKEFPILLSVQFPTEPESFSNLIFTITDISDQKQTEQKLRNSERQFEDFMNHLPGVVDIKDNNGNIIFCNRLYASSLNLNPEEIIGKTIKALLPEEIVEQFEKENSEVLDTLLPQKYENILPNEDGHTYWLTRKFPIIREEGPPHLGMIGLDFTDRKMAEEELKKSEMLYRSLIEKSEMLLSRWLPDTTLTYANDKYLKTFNIPENYQNFKWINLLQEKDHLERLAHYRKASQKPTTSVYEETIITSDGEEKFYQWISNPLQIEDGKVIEFHGVGIDITERKKAEIILRTHQEKLQKEVDAQTAKLREMVNLMAGREVRMAELKSIITQLQNQLLNAGLEPIADDPLSIERSE